MRESGKAKTVQSTQDVIQNNKTALDAVAVVVEDVSCFSALHCFQYRFSCIFVDTLWINILFSLDVRDLFSATFW